MKLIKLAGFIGKMEMFVKSNDHTILAGMAVIGTGLTLYSSFKSGLKADDVIKKFKEDLSFCKDDDKNAKKEVVKEFVKDITPIVIKPLLFGAATMACVVCSHRASSKRIAALTAAYTLSDASFKDLSSKMDEVLGSKKSSSIKESVIKDNFDKDNKKPDQATIFVTGHGDVLCKDLYTGVSFYSNAMKIEQAINDLSKDVLGTMFVTINELYDLLDIDTHPDLGEELGWGIDDLASGRLPITLTALLTEEGIPCICMKYTIDVKACMKDYRYL